MPEENKQWRHELKFVCTNQQLAIIESRIKPMLSPDPHVKDSGQYCIRSVYFDDWKDTCYRENEDGTDPREKFRIRIYDGNAEYIMLELKQKQRGMTRKLSCPLTAAQCGAAVQGEMLEISGGSPALLRKFALEQRQRQLRAKTIVEYDRTPYVFRLGNVRITLDKNIRAASKTGRFLNGDFLRRPIMRTGEHVLEVKYDAFLPDPVRQVLALDTLRRTSFSKYYLCRYFSGGC